MTNKTGKKLAVDAVLLPPDEILDLAVRVNRDLIREGGEKIVLDPVSCLPHVTLAMGAADEADLPKLEKILQAAGLEFLPVNLRIAGLYARPSASGEIITGFEIEKSRELQSLHDHLLRESASLLSPQADRGMFFNPEEVKESSPRFLAYFREKASGPAYFPHITLGAGETGLHQAPFSFQASRLALCHLGDYCTCREILWEIRI